MFVNEVVENVINISNLNKKVDFIVKYGIIVI